MSDEAEEGPSNRDLYTIEAETASREQLEELFNASCRLRRTFAAKSETVEELSDVERVIKRGPRKALEIAYINMRLALDIEALKIALKRNYGESRDVG